MSSIATIRKAALFGSLYLSQTVPKGYLKFLPVLMAEKGDSMLAISLVALFSFGDWSKPIVAVLFDSNKLSSRSARKNVILSIQIIIISIFCYSLTLDSPKLSQLAGLFSLCSFLTTVHDTAVDGLAVKVLLNKHEQSIGGFGQYIGYKLGSLLTGGILPAIVGSDHRKLCIGIIFSMSIVLLFTYLYDINDEEGEYEVSHNSHNTSASSVVSVPMMKQLLLTSPGIKMMLLLLLYKFADHGLDFIWSPMLVQAKLSRKTIVQTQFIIGSLASILGAVLGNKLSHYLEDISLSLAICSFFRILPNLMQLLFNYIHLTHTSNATTATVFVTIHAIVENIAGAAVTCCMFAYLLEHSNKNFPTTSYAILNTIALVGMSLGEVVLSLVSHYCGFTTACALGLLINLAFPWLLLSFRKGIESEEREKRKLVAD